MGWTGVAHLAGGTGLLQHRPSLEEHPTHVGDVSVGGLGGNHFQGFLFAGGGGGGMLVQSDPSVRRLPLRLRRGRTFFITN